MTAAVTAIYRYPVQGLSAEELDRVAPLPGELPSTRSRFCHRLASTAFDPEQPQWLSKIHFVMPASLAANRQPTLKAEQRQQPGNLCPTKDVG
jgi:hypothetical protein